MSAAVNRSHAPETGINYDSLTTTSTTTTKHIPQDWAFTGYTQVW
jgi:hypothetical protein